MNENIGDVGTELTLDHLRAFRDRLDAADAPVRRVDGCLLCNRFVGTQPEMYHHWLDDHGIDPAKAMYGDL